MIFKIIVKSLFIFFLLVNLVAKANDIASEDEAFGEIFKLILIASLPFFKPSTDSTLALGSLRV